MSYANGGVNRYRSEGDVLADLDRILTSGVDLAMNLRAIDEWIAGLSKDDLLTLVDGEDGDMQKIVATAPHGTDQLLNHIFEDAA